MSSEKQISADERLFRLEALLNQDVLKHEMVSKTEHYPKDFANYLRTSEVTDALKIGTDKEGGFLVTDDMEDEIIEGAKERCFMRQISTVIKTKNRLRIPGVLKHGEAEWVDESEQLHFTEKEFFENVLDAHKNGLIIKVSDELLEDESFGLERYIAKSAGESVGVLEEEAFINGDGDHEPRGFILDAQVGAEVPELDMDAALDLYYSLRRPYRKNAVWYMSDDAFKKLRKERTAAGRPAWEGDITKKEPIKLLGKRVYVSSYMPEMLPGNCPMAFGDFSFFWIADRGNRSIKRLNEIYSDKGMVGFRMTHRVDSKLMVPEAIQTLKIAS